MSKTDRIKFLVILLTFFSSLAFFGWFLREGIIRPRATGEQVNITFTPKTNTYQVEGSQTLTVILQPSDNSKKISGLDITFRAQDNAQLIDIGRPTPIDGPNAGSSTFFSDLIKQVSPTVGRISTVNQNADDQQLPHAVSIRITFKGGGVGTGKILVSSSSTQIVGNISSSAYSLGIVDEGNFNFTPPPTLTTYPLRKIASPPVIDGSLSEFGGAQSIIFGGPTNNSVIVKAFWDDTNIYLGYIVRDYQLNFATSQRDGNVWEDDAVEWFIDIQNNGGGNQNPDSAFMLPDDFQGIVNINNTQFDTQGSASGAPSLFWNGPWQSAVSTGGSVNSNSDTDSAYTAEVKIPWTSLGLSTAPAPGTTFGISFAVDDKDADSMTSVMWPNITTVFQNASKWQKAQLIADSAAAAVTPTGSPPTSTPIPFPTFPPPSPYTTAVAPTPTITPVSPTNFISATPFPTAIPSAAPSLIGDSIPTIPDVLTFLIRGFFVIAGLGALTYLSWGAYSWITSGGDPELLQKAQSKMVAAIVGLVLVVGVVSAAAVFEQVVFSQKICFGISCPLELPQLIK